MTLDIIVVTHTMQGEHTAKVDLSHHNLKVYYSLWQAITAYETINADVVLLDGTQPRFKHQFVQVPNQCGDIYERISPKIMDLFELGVKKIGWIKLPDDYEPKDKIFKMSYSDGDLKGEFVQLTSHEFIKNVDPSVHWAALPKNGYAPQWAKALEVVMGA